jgi:hypothetical protein
VRFTKHAMDRMARLHISQEMVERVLLDPEWSSATTRNTRYDAIVEGRRLCVVVAEEWSEPVVVSTFWFREGTR